MTFRTRLPNGGVSDGLFRVVGSRVSALGQAGSRRKIRGLESRVSVDRLSVRRAHGAPGRLLMRLGLATSQVSI